MNEEDLFRSMSSIDDELIEKSYKKPNNNGYRIAAAAACAAIICAVASYEINILKKAKSDNQIPNPPEVIESQINENCTTLPESESSNTADSIEDKASTDYKSLFSMQVESADENYSKAKKNNSNAFLPDDEYARYEYRTKSSLPLKLAGTEYFENGNLISYCNENKKITNTVIKYSDINNEKCINIIVNENGKFYGDYSSVDIEKNGVEHLGTSICASSYKDSSNTLYLSAFFKKDNEAFSIKSSGLSYDECGIILDSLIESDISFPSLDKTKAVYVSNDK